MQTAFISHPDCLRHAMIADHPESRERLDAIQNQLIATGLFGYLRHYDAPQATVEQLHRVHSSSHIENIMAQAPTAGLAHIDPDTYMNPFTLTAALRAAGAVVLATELGHVFCPPDEHDGCAERVDG